MTVSVTWSRQASRAVQHELPHPVAAAVIEFVLGPLAENPARVGNPLGPPLQGLHVARRGAFRVIYRIAEDASAVHVVAVRHRRDVYHS